MSKLVPLCTCHLPKKAADIGFHMTKVEGDSCKFCNHYVYWGEDWKVTMSSSEMDKVDMSKGKDWKKKRIQKAKNMFRDGTKISEIARKLKVHRSAVGYWQREGML